MILFEPIPDSASIAPLKAAWLSGLTAPFDGMWETGFIDSSPHFHVRIDGNVAGYFVVNDEGVLLQFYLGPDHLAMGKEIFREVIGRDSMKSAIVQTIDPLFLSLCLDSHLNLSVHTYLYEHEMHIEAVHPASSGTELQVALLENLDRVNDFQIACLGGQEELRSWLQGYSSNLIGRSELFVLSSGSEWIGLGEYRKSDTQENVVDVGVMVHPDHRGNKWAAYILSLLAEQGTADGHKVICSTTVENAASQKAIARAGFVSRNRILNIQF